VLNIEAILLQLVTALILARYVRLLIIKPMKQLHDGADRIGQGDLNHRITMVRKDEIGQLASAFNSMAADLEKHQDNLQTVMAYNYEVKRANELARSNTMNLALSKVATLLESSSNSELILDTLGAELKKLDLDCGVVTVDPAGEVATIKYLSFNPALLQTVEKLAGVSAKNYVIPKRYWPDDRAMKERIPVWYSNPENTLRGMFPQIPEMVAKKALSLLGFKSEMQLCMLPLINQEQVLGTLIIWGVELYPSDDAILSVFASQVAGILKNAIAHENETKRANELARTNTMILALSKVAAQLESSSDSDMIFKTIGNELKKMRLESMVGILDDAKQNLQMKYISVNPDIVRWVEKMTGYHLSDLTIPRRLWPTQKVVDERQPYWTSVNSTRNVFPILPESIQKNARKMAGINPNDPVCYLPIATEHKAIGILCVWGTELQRSDMPALSILANQIATAIGNSNQYEAEVRRRQEKEVLLKEIHHRVKNNLQIISSLLKLQSRQITDPLLLQVMQDSQSRVRSMALIHEKLYQSQSLARIDFGEYVKSLATDLFRSYQHNFMGIQLKVQMDEVALDLDHAVSCGLILNELMTNALKYAFPDGRNGTIWVELRTNSEHILSLRVADNGVGIPADFDIRNATSLGLQLVNSLVGQLDGKMELERSNGTEFRVSFEY
jgi:two-component sensor histidine kinase/HAMP domain-containing protein